jgi:carboxylesterase
MRDHSIVLTGGRVGVVLLHGLGGTPHEMRGLAEGLHAVGHTVCVPQLAGHCGSIEDLKASRWTDWAASGARAIADVGRTCDTVVVGGLSTGAILSLYLAQTSPKQVAGLVLLAPTLWLNGWVIPRYAALFRLVLDKWTANRFAFPDTPPHGIKNPTIRAKVAAALHSGDSSIAGVPVTPGGAVLEHRWLVTAVRKRLQDVSVPILIIHPREDDYADFDNIAYIIRHVSSQVETLTLNDSYHVITVDQQADQVTAQTCAFLHQHFGASANTPALRLVR